MAGRRTLGGAADLIWKETQKVIKSKMTPPPLTVPKRIPVVDFAKPASVGDWTWGSDKAIGGLSECELEHNSDEGHAVWSGNLSTEIPANSRVTRSGYCNLRSVPAMPSLFGETFLDLSLYEGLEFVIKGDGRSYIANIQTAGMQQEDLFQAFLYTRGGPLWQTIQIPFNDFLLTNSGYVQNEQPMLDVTRINTVGVLLADRMDGPFELALRSISAIPMSREVTDMDASDT